MVVFRYVVLCLCAYFPLIAEAVGRLNTIVIVASKPHYDMVHRIETALFSESTFHASIRHVDIEKLNSEIFENPAIDLVVTLGEQTFAKTLPVISKRPLLATLIHKADYQRLLYENSTYLNPESPDITALFLDQPIDRMLNLVKCLTLDGYKEHTAGVLLGPESSGFQSALLDSAQQRDLSLNIAHLNLYENPIQPLQHILEKSRVLLALPDSNVYNAQTAKAVLLSAFRRRVPVIAFSKTYVHIGALAAVYSSPGQLATEIAEKINHIIQNPDKPLIGPQFPKNFQVMMNSHVAKTFSLPFYSESQLKYALEDMEDHHKMVCHIRKGTE